MHTDVLQPGRQPESQRIVSAPPSGLKRRLRRWLYAHVQVSGFFLEQLRSEMNGFAVRISYRIHPLRISQLRHLWQRRDL